MEQQNFALGTVGWGNDANYYDLGSAGTDKCLVRVTLVWGRNPAQPLTGTSAQGQKIVATLPGPIFHLPDLGDLVELGIPQGMERIPGAATIRGWHKATPQGFSASNAMWPIEDGKTVSIGDQNADFLALASKVLQAVQDLQAQFKSWVVSPNDGGAALKTILTTPVTGWAEKSYDFATTKLKGT